jgi:Transposase family tnp2
MMSLMISGPKQPGNDIDVFLAPMIEELKKYVGERSKGMRCISERVLHPLFMLLYIINDFSTYGNLSGFKTKGARACPICQEDTCSIWLKKIKKTVYLGHRKFLFRLPKRHPHPYQKMIK